jgi:hypothetical protein
MDDIFRTELSETFFDFFRLAEVIYNRDYSSEAFHPGTLLSDDLRQSATDLHKYLTKEKSVSASSVALAATVMGREIHLLESKINDDRFEDKIPHPLRVEILTLIDAARKFLRRMQKSNIAHLDAKTTSRAMIKQTFNKSGAGDSYIPPSRQGKKAFIVYLEKDDSEALRLLSRLRGEPVQKIVRSLIQEHITRDEIRAALDQELATLQAKRLALPK